MTKKIYFKKQKVKNGLNNIYSSLSNYGMTPPVQNMKTTVYNSRYDLYTLNWQNLSYRYSTDGIFKTLVEQPILDAIKGDLTIKTDLLSQEEIDIIKDNLFKKDIEEVLKRFFIWDRLFGGSGLIIEVAGQDTSQPLTMNDIKKGDEVNYYAVDRWELSSSQFKTLDQIQQNEYSQENDNYFYYYDNKINQDRIILLKGVYAPTMVRAQLLGWGLSVVEPLVAPSNMYTKTLNLIYELIDEQKIDVYKIDDFKNIIATGNDKEVIDRLQLTNLIKNYVNAIVMDKNDEYDQKQLNTSGLVEILHELKLDICSCMKMPMTKIWGVSPSGFNSGENDLKNYNAMVESEVRGKVYSVLKKIINIEAKCLFDITLHDLIISYPSLEQPNAEQVENSKDRIFSRLITLRSNGLLSTERLNEYINNENIFNSSVELEETGQSFQGQGVKDNFNIDL